MKAWVAGSRRLSVAVIAALALLAATGRAHAERDVRIEINYQGLELGYDPATSSLSMNENAGSTSIGLLLEDGTIVDRADIYNSLIEPGAFQLLWGARVVNGPMQDDLELTESVIWATDINTSPVNPSLRAGFTNDNLMGIDADGVIFGGGVLRIEGVLALTTDDGSILVHPTGGNWIYRGEDDGPMGEGADGTMDQFTIQSIARDSYRLGVMAVLEIGIRHFRDGTSTSGLNADSFFEMAGLHGGFFSDSAHLQLTVIPEPTTGVMGLVGAVLRLRRRRSRS
jgi:hypothetical protein